MPLIACDRVTLRYDRTVAVEDLTFTVERGAALCIVGENGSGKSSLVKALLGLMPVASGQIRYEAGFGPRQIGYLPQQTALQRDFPASVYEIVLSGCLSRMGLRPYYTAAERRRAEAALGRLGIAALRDRSYHELSGGQQQRVLLARALCAASALLLLDEPVAGLDPLATQELYQVIGELHREAGMTVITVSHDVAAAVNQATHILHLRKGALFFGTAEAYRQSAVGRLFLTEGCHA